MRLLAPALLLTLYIAGCSTTAPAPSRQIIIDEPYQSVYKRVSAIAKRCMAFTWIGAGNTIDAELYSDLGEAEITAHMQGMLGRTHLLTIDIKKNTDQLTAVALSGKSVEVKRAHRWVIDNTDEC